MPSVSKRPTNTLKVPDSILRDWFAGQALSRITPIFKPEESELGASYAYDYADAMMEERARRKERDS